MDNTNHRTGCKCIMCDKTRAGKTHTKVCISIPIDCWSDFGDECLLVGEQKSPMLAKLIGLFLKKRKEKRA